MKDKVWNFVKNKRNKLIVLLTLVALSAGSFYATGYEVSPDNEHLLFNNAVQNAEQFKEKLESAQKNNKKGPVMSDLATVLIRFREVIDAPPLGSAVDAFAQFNIATYMLEYREIFFQAGISEIEVYLGAREFLIGALRDYYDEDFVKQLEIVNELAKQALQDELGYSEEEAEDILQEEDALPDGEERTTTPGKLPGRGLFEWEY